MILTGIIKDQEGSLPSANIYVSDDTGKPLSPLKGDSSDVVTGGYILENLKPTDYVTVSYTGYKKITKKISDLGTKEVIQYDFTLMPDTANIPTFEFVEEKIIPLPVKKQNKTLVYAGIGIGSLLVGLLVFKSLK